MSSSVDFTTIIREFSDAVMMSTCPHERVVVDSEEATTRSGREEERLVPIRIYTCLDCSIQWSEEI